MNCKGCNRPAKAERLPHRWKRIGEASYCPQCLHERYVVRTVAMTVVEPLGATWLEFRAALLESWAQVTSAANWMVTELFARDVRRQDEVKMPPMPRVYLYPEARRLFPGLAPLTIASLAHTTQALYVAARYHVIWTHARSLPTYRYPVPLPIHNQLWRATMVDGRPIVRVRVGDRWWDLRLKGGPRYRRQLTAYEQIIAGEAIAGELALYRRRAHEGPIMARPNGNQRAPYAVACKIFAWLPRARDEAAGTASGTLRVWTANDTLLTAVDINDETWRYHGDHLRRWSAEYRRIRQRFAEDCQVDQRLAPAVADRRTAVALRYQRRMRSAVREAAAHVVGHARRKRCATVLYDDSVRVFCPDFPFAALRERLRTDCDAAGLRFEYSSDGDSARPDGHLATMALTFSGPPVGPARSPAGARIGTPSR
jgi:hypothetical protein